LVVPERAARRGVCWTQVEVASGGFTLVREQLRPVKTGFVRILADAVKEKSKAGLANVNEGPEVPAKVKREEV
jgi:hypothetical protein